MRYLLRILLVVALVVGSAFVACKPKVEVENVAPNPDILTLDLRNLSLTTATVDVTVTVENPNPIGATLDRIAYDIYFEENGRWVHLGTADRLEDVTIRASSSTAFDISNDITILSACRALFQAVTTEVTVNIKVSGSAWFKVGPASFEVPFEEVRALSADLRITKLELMPLDRGEPVRVDHPVSINAIVENSGDVAASKTFTCTVNGFGPYSQTVEVPAHDSKKIAWIFYPKNAGSYTTDVDSLRRTFMVAP